MAFSFSIDHRRARAARATAGGPSSRFRSSHQDLAARLARATYGEVRFDAGSRALYSTDASNYRQIPIGVVVPASIDDFVTTVGLCREHEVPLLMRGGGTSLAGQTCNSAVVIDFSKYLNPVTGNRSRAAACTRTARLHSGRPTQTGRGTSPYVRS
ncbi:FAD-binding protein [Bradyrhizobium icense]|uniref:FAD-binding oxidoreductase n=1 Tax=Bradyrhizobium icense TaxID=1274631 RepID=UPI0018D3D2AD